jgi:NADPH:quinone reductase-like Zn-dependent oxidoreductase
VKAYVLSEVGKGVGAWKLVERPDPVAGPGEVLIGIRAASLNYRDLMIAGGVYVRPLKEEVIPLSDGAGEVLALGEGVTQLKVGDRVMGAFAPRWIDGPLHPRYLDFALGGSIDGMLAEKAVLPSSGVVKIPTHLSWEEAATLPCAAVTAWHALMESQPPLKPGSTVLVLGSGGVSVFALQFAKAAGLRVIGTSSSDAKLDRLRQLGLDHGINYKKTPEWQEEVKRITGGEGVDQVIEVAGATLPRSLQSVKPGGVINMIGAVAGGFDQPLNLLSVFMSGARLQPIFVGSVAMFAAMTRAIDVNQIHPVIDEVFAFERANEALAKLKRGAHFGKIVVATRS